jgi:hypothetical protein
MLDSFTDEQLERLSAKAREIARLSGTGSFIDVGLREVYYKQPL